MNVRNMCDNQLELSKFLIKTHDNLNTDMHKNVIER